MKDIAKKDLVGYGVSLMGGVEAPGRGLIAGISTVVPVPMATPSPSPPNPSEATAASRERRTC